MDEPAARRAESIDRQTCEIDIRGLGADALRLLRCLVDSRRRAVYLDAHIARYLRDHGHLPTYGQLAERLSFVVDGERVALISRSTARWAIVRWKRECIAVSSDTQIRTESL